MFTDQDVKDPLSNLLLDFFPSADSLRIKCWKKDILLKFVLYL